MMHTETAFQFMENSGIVAGMRGHFPPDVALRTTQAMMDEAINAFEFTMNSTQPIEAMQAVKAEFGDTACVGMGTVLDLDIAKRVLDAGADFVVSPAFQPEIVEYVVSQNVFIAPGVITPSECVQAWLTDVPMLKIFPIGSMGLNYFKSVKGPLNHMKFMCNGGMTDQNAKDFLQAGAVCCGMAGWLTGDGTWETDKLRQRAKILRDIVQEVRSGEDTRVI